MEVLEGKWHSRGREEAQIVKLTNGNEAAMQEVGLSIVDGVKLTNEEAMQESGLSIVDFVNIVLHDHSFRMINKWVMKVLRRGKGRERGVEYRGDSV